MLEQKTRFTVFRLRVEDLINNKKWLVFRRYTDFVELKHQLIESFPDLSLDLPSKRIVKNNFDPIFLERRQLGLQLFLNQILSYESVVDSLSVQQFLAFSQTNDRDIGATDSLYCKQSVIYFDSLLNAKDQEIQRLKQKIESLELQIQSKDRLLYSGSQINVGIRESPDGSTSSPSNSEFNKSFSNS